MALATLLGRFVSQVRKILRTYELFTGCKPSYPATYDLRQSGQVTPVRGRGVCWYMLGIRYIWIAGIEPYVHQSWDFSESNMKNLAGFDNDPNDGGGDMYMAMAYLLRWAGPVNETDDPYLPPYPETSPSGLTVQKHVQNVTILPFRSGPLDNDAIKSALTVYGGVWASMYLERKQL